MFPAGNMNTPEEEMWKYISYALGGSTAGLLILVCSLLSVICVLTVKLSKYRRQDSNKRAGTSSSAGI